MFEDRIWGDGFIEDGRRELEISVVVRRRLPRQRENRLLGPRRRSRVLRPDGLHRFGLKYWHGALARDVGRTDKKIVVRYDPRDISRVFVARPSGRFIEARWQDLTLPPVSLHEWRNELKARNKTARDECDTRAMMKAIAQKRQIVDRASAATLLARETVVEKSRLDTLNIGYGKLRGVDSSLPVPGEEYGASMTKAISTRRRQSFSPFHQRAHTRH
jgi:putative transposase